MGAGGMYCPSPNMGLEVGYRLPFSICDALLATACCLPCAMGVRLVDGDARHLKLRQR